MWFCHLRIQASGSTILFLSVRSPLVLSGIKIVKRQFQFSRSTSFAYCRLTCSPSVVIMLPMRVKKLLKEYGIASLIIAALISIFFYDVIFAGKTFKVSTANAQALSYGAYGQAENKPTFIPVNGTDASVMEEPVYAFIGKWLRKGVLPLWNPHQACGFSLIAMLEIGLFFPLHLIVYFLPDAWGMDLLILSRLFLAGILVYWLMRLWRLPKISALTASIVMMFAGPMLVLQYWTTNVDMLAPLILIATELLIKNPNRKTIASLAAVVGLTFFAGHPEHIFFVNLLGFLYFVFRVFSSIVIPAPVLERLQGGPGKAGIQLDSHSRGNDKLKIIC